MSNHAKTLGTELFSLAGVEMNGPNPWDIQIHDERTYHRVIKDHTLGLGESFMEGWWSSQCLDETISRLLAAGLEQKVKRNPKLVLRLLMSRFFNLQTHKRAQRVADIHYNLDNDLYRLMLGPTMSYTCGYWKKAKDLNAAQDHKHDLICRKLDLKPGDKVLELGSGWGGFAEYAAKNYGVELTTINISKEQVAYAEKRCQGLPVSVHLCDYRDTQAFNPNGIQYDKAVSIGMFEHVGHKNYRHFMKIAYDNLKDHGMFLLHTIGGNRITNRIEPWHGKYIFPDGVLPASQQLATAMQDLFIVEDWHNFGSDYDKTLMAWHQNFDANWATLQSKYDQRFYRMWSYYLLSCAGMFRARDAQLWQLVLSKNGFPGGYLSIR